MHTLKLVHFIFLALLLATNSNAETINGTVTRITDGDTVTLTSLAGERIKVRLNAIDAPEKKQAFSKASSRSLAKLCLNQSARVVTNKLDKYGRSIGDLFCNGIFANEYLVSNGFAWVYRKYSNDARLLKLEANAHASYIGLWSDPEPLPPWEWRKAKREGKKPSKMIRSEKNYFTGSTNNLDCKKRAFCKNMTSCKEAKFYLNKCGATRLDRDHDGVPCESLCH